GVTRLAYDGTVLPISSNEIVTAEVTTRDIDRGDAPHFLLKEISEAPESFRKTLRGKIVERDGVLHASLGVKTLPTSIIEQLASGAIRKVRVIGQGTAAIAGRSCATVLDELCAGGLDVDPITATELSGFHLQLDMSDTLIIAVSQSGTTTDTNRTVDLARSRGASVLAIVNRRGSDLCDKADGVLFTSDGRDVEMSVASTKAFYAQVAAGVLLACAVSVAAGSEQIRAGMICCARCVNFPPPCVRSLTREQRLLKLLTNMRRPSAIGLSWVMARTRLQPTKYALS
ncbi:MAG: putative glucosamine-6-phosphate synthase, partial [Actinomycetota bacterium]